MSIIDLILTALSILRITMLLHNEDGPGHIFKQVRDKVGVRKERVQVARDNDIWLDWQCVGEGFWAELLCCPYCLSGWVALVLVLMQKTMRPIFRLIILWMGLWGFVYLILNYFDQDN